jgi:hypothetical protein
MAGPELGEHRRPRGRHCCVSCRRAAAFALLLRGLQGASLLPGGAGSGGYGASQRGLAPKRTITGRGKVDRGVVGALRQ